MHCSHKSRRSHVNHCVTPAARPNAASYTAEWTSWCRSQLDSECSEDDKVAESAGEVTMSLLNAAMEKLNQVATNAGQAGPLTFNSI